MDSEKGGSESAEVVNIEEHNADTEKSNGDEDHVKGVDDCNNNSDVSGQFVSNM